MKKPRIAAIDIGTNSIRCIIAEASTDGKFKILDDEKATVRLGEKLAMTGVISDEASNRAIEAIRRFRKLVTGLHVEAVEAVATSAIRTAANGRGLVALLSTELGHEIRVISGEEEAELTAASSLSNFDMYGKRYAMVDIGGGSVEVIMACGNHVEEFYSLDLGAVVMTDRFLASDPIAEDELNKLQRHIRASLKRTFTGKRVTVDSLIGSGGTLTALGYMAMQMRKDNYVSIHGYEVLRSEVVHLLAMLIRKDLKGRRTIPGLNQDRADIIVAGVVLIDELMHFFDANRVLVNERGIREGLLIRAMKRLGLAAVSSTAPTWRDAVNDFARSCHVDEPHAAHVAGMALSIFDALALPFGLNKPERKLLEAAAILHDSGYFISYGSHVSDAITRTGMDLMKAQVELLGESDHDRQLQLIRGTFAAHNASSSAAPQAVVVPAHRPSDGEILAEALKIGDMLLKRAIRHRAGATWVGVSVTQDAEFRLAPLGPDLYDGVPGVVLFLAYLTEMTGNSIYRTVAEEAWQTMWNGILEGPALGAGAFTGWAGLVYVSLLLHRLWRDKRDLYRAVGCLGRLRTTPTVGFATDVVAGMAGCVLVLLGAYRLWPSDHLLCTARRLGDALVDTAQLSDVGASWVGVVDTERPLTGFAHGAAGISLALLKLHRLTGVESFAQIGRAAMAYERHCYSADHQNWPDFRHVPPTFMVAWCHGAAGIVLARAEAYASDPDSSIISDVKGGLITVERAGFGANHSLCHGDFGNIEAVIAGRRLLNSDHVISHAQWVGGVLDDIRRRGPVCGDRRAGSLELLGLMTGLAGIGYGLLRAIDPDNVPNVLLLEFPRPKNHDNSICIL